MMNTYDLVRRLVQMDPTGTNPVMLSVSFADKDMPTSKSGFVQDLSLESFKDSDGTQDVTVLLATDG